MDHKTKAPLEVEEEVKTAGGIVTVTLMFFQRPVAVGRAADAMTAKHKAYDRLCSALLRISEAK